MKLVLPEQITKEMHAAYIEDWSEEKIVPYASRLNGKPYEEWLNGVILSRTRVPAHLVPSTLLFSVNDDGTKILGAVDIRHSLNEHLLNYGGHIGYGIVPSERGKGYAKEQLRLALPVARALGITKALICCDDLNPGSAKTIEAAGGVLEDKRQNSDELTRRYWVETPQKTLETERLILRAWTMDDVDDLYAYAVNPKIGPAAGWKPHESREESAEIVSRWVDSTEVWAIEEKVSGKVIGSIGLHRDPHRSNPRSKMIGYVLREESWGQGYMPEAVRRMTKFAFEELCMDMISIQHFAFNNQSRRVIEKCGYHYEGTLRRSVSIFNGSVHDELVWSMTREEYFAASAER